MTWLFSILAGAALLSVLLRRPWTTVIARRSAHPSEWNHPLFREANMALSLAWAAVFALTAVVSAFGGPILTAATMVLNPALGWASPRLGRAYAAWRARAEDGS